MRFQECYFNSSRKHKTSSTFAEMGPYPDQTSPIKPGLLQVFQLQHKVFLGQKPEEVKKENAEHKER